MSEDFGFFTAAIDAATTIEQRTGSRMSIRELTHFVGGKHVSGTSGRFADVFDPNTGEVQARVPLADARRGRGRDRRTPKTRSRSGRRGTRRSAPAC